MSDGRNGSVARWLQVGSLIAVAACTGRGDAVRVIDEAFITPFDSVDNVDSPATYHSEDTHWLLATAKTGDAVLVYDAATGRVIRRIGRSGHGATNLRRPNGIVVADSLLLVVERDNARVHAYRLPSFASIATFGENILRKPYGIAVRPDGSGGWTVWVTDNYETPDGGIPPDRELGARVKEFRLREDGMAPAVTLVGSFGDTTTHGALRTVESIMADPSMGRLLIAEETESDSHLKVYDLEGRFTGQIVGRGRFPQQAEGLALYRCGDRDGYWIATDQGDSVNSFHVFDRESFRHLGAFTGRRARRTDGIVLTQLPFGPFPAGALFVSHLDGGVAAFSWQSIARALTLRGDCQG